MTLDPYKILKISRDAPDEVIRAAYKVLASKYHPDKNPGDEASARMMQHVNDAYALLSDPIRRSEYDRKSTGGTEQSATEQPNSGSKRVTIYCRSCRRPLRLSEDVLSAPERFKVTCPGCQKDPFVEPKRSQAAPQEFPKSVINCKHCGQSIRVLSAAIQQPDRFDVVCPKCNRNPIPKQEFPKSVINCKHCGQSIRVLSAAIQQPDRFDVVCPKCNRNPIPETADYKYTQSPKSYNGSSHTIHSAIQKNNTSNNFTTSKNYIKHSFGVLMNIVKIAFLIIILIGGISSLLEYFSKNSRQYDGNHPSTAKTIDPKLTSTFSQPIQPLPQTGDNTASFGNGVAPLSIKTSPSGGYHYFVKIVDVVSHQELGSYFIRSGEIVEIKVPVGTYEIKYASGKQWYGIGHLFGPETAYSKAESLFTFSFDGYQYSGYTVELIMQRNGNLRTSGIQPSQW
jgi:Zn finger protein HypA/HybF involved in hydrogenase expression